MNTSITTTNVTAESLVSLIGTYDDIDAHDVEKITGSKDHITTIIITINFSKNKECSGTRHAESH